MKKILICLIAFSSTIFLQSQNCNIKFGIKGGVNISTLKSNDEAFSWRPFFYFGVLSNKRVSNKISLQAELNYSRQGAKSNIRTAYIFPVIDPVINYLTLPILLQYTPYKGFLLNTGPQLGLLINQGSDKAFTKLDLAWTFGMGYKFNCGFGIDARYSLGISQASNLSADIFTRVLQSGIFYRFDKK